MPFIRFEDIYFTDHYNIIIIYIILIFAQRDKLERLSEYAVVYKTTTINRMPDLELYLEEGFLLVL